MYILLSSCQNPDILRIIYFIQLLLEIVLTIVPIALIAILMFDFAKMVVSSTEEEQKKALKIASTRMISAVAIFFVPTVVSLIMNTLGSLGVDYATCITNANSATIAHYQQIQDLLEEEEELKIKEELQIKLDIAYEKANAELAARQASVYGAGKASDDSSYKNMAGKMLSIAKGELGYKEGANDDNKYGRELGNNNVAWCAIFVRWVMLHTGYNNQNLLNDVIEKEGKISNPHGAINSIYNFSTHSNLDFYYSKNYGGNYVPKKGDIIYYWWARNWNKQITPTMWAENSHVGIVDYVSNGLVYTVEGNYNRGVGSRSISLESNQIMGYGSWYTQK